MNVERTVSIPAAIGGVDGVYSESAAWARNFICLSASASFKVQFGQNQPFDASVGVSRDAGPDGIGQMVLSNMTATAITATFVLSDGAHESPPASLTSDLLFPDSNTQAGGNWATNTFAANAKYFYPGTRTINGVSRQRKYIYISNRQGIGDEVGIESATSINDPAPIHLATVQGSQSARLDLSADLILRNLQGAGIKANVFEVF